MLLRTPSVFVSTPEGLQPPCVITMLHFCGKQMQSRCLRTLILNTLDWPTQPHVPWEGIFRWAKTYVLFTKSWRSKLCLTYFSFCCSRWNIVTHSGGNLETQVFHYEPRLQQEKRWAEKHSLMSGPGLELNLSELLMELVNYSKQPILRFWHIWGVRLFSMHLKVHAWQRMYYLLTILDFPWV